MATDWPKEVFPSERDAQQSEPQTESTLKSEPQSEPRKPGVICPHCADDPMTTWHEQLMDSNGLITLLVSCFKCRTYLGTAVIGRVDTKGGRIIRPS